VLRFVFMQRLIGNFIVICDIFDLFGNVVSKQRVSRLDSLSTQMNIVFRNLKLQCLPASLNQFPVGCSLPEIRVILETLSTKTGDGNGGGTST